MIFIDPGYIPKSRPTPTIAKVPAAPPPPTSVALTLADLYRLIPETGWNRPLLASLWDRRESQLGAWRLVNRLAKEFRTTDRYHLRRVRKAIWQDLGLLTRQGWVIRKAGKIQMNLLHITGQSSL